MSSSNVNNSTKATENLQNLTLSEAIMRSQLILKKSLELEELRKKFCHVIKSRLQPGGITPGGITPENQIALDKIIEGLENIAKSGEDAQKDSKELRSLLFPKKDLLEEKNISLLHAHQNRSIAGESIEGKASLSPPRASRKPQNLDEQLHEDVSNFFKMSIVQRNPIRDSTLKAARELIELGANPNWEEIPGVSLNAIGIAWDNKDKDFGTDLKNAFTNITNIKKQNNNKTGPK